MMFHAFPGNIEYCVNCHMIRADYFLVSTLEEDGCIKALRKKLSKVCQHEDKTKIFGTHHLKGVTY